jgi:hypothetical protein
MYTNDETDVWAQMLKIQVLMGMLPYQVADSSDVLEELAASIFQGVYSS